MSMKNTAIFYFFFFFFFFFLGGLFLEPLVGRAFHALHREFVIAEFATHFTR